MFGGLLLAVALVHPVVKRLPITTTIVYLLAGVGLGPYGLNVLRIDPAHDAAWLYHGAELTVLLSLFTVGMKLRVRLHDPVLRPALGLATISMILTVALITVVAIVGMNLPLGAAVLLGAILAPTDPVLASDVQLRHPRDRDRVRMTLSVESGINDGTAFPLVTLGLGLLGLHGLGPWGWHWALFDVLWGGIGGLLIGASLGYGLGRLILFLHRRTGKLVSFGEYLVIGLIGVSYGAAVELHAYGFLSVFAASVALRAVERKASAANQKLYAESGEQDVDDEARDAPATLAGMLLSTNEQLEHILEVALVVLVGASLPEIRFDPNAWWFVPLLFLVLRPLACLPVLLVSGFSRFELGTVSWFGIRGIGSLYYVLYAVEQHLPAGIADTLISLTLTTIALSILAHGISVTPLLDLYQSRRKQS